MNQEVRELIKQEVLDRYDISDILNLIKLNEDDWSEFYDCIEKYVLKNLSEFNLDCIKPTVTEEDYYEDEETYEDF